MSQCVFYADVQIMGLTVSVSKRHLWMTAIYSKHNNME